MAKYRLSTASWRGGASTFRLGGPALTALPLALSALKPGFFPATLEPLRRQQSRAATSSPSVSAPRAR
jgi:hypothetical protein